MYIRSSANHPISVSEEGASETHSGGALQVNKTAASVGVTTTPSFRGSKNTSKSSSKNPIQVSGDSCTSLKSSRGKRKHVIAHKSLSKASNHSDRSEKMKLATTGKIIHSYVLYLLYISYIHFCMSPFTLMWP